MSGILRNASLAGAMMGVLCGDDSKASNKWKKRYLEKVPGISFPEDFDALPEEEKTKRLDRAIQAGLSEKGR